MVGEAETVVRAGATGERLTERRVAFMRYHGQGHEIEIELPSRPLLQDDIPALKSAFEKDYSQQFSRTVPGMTIEILNWGVSISSEGTSLEGLETTSIRTPRKAQETREILCDVTGDIRTAGVLDRHSLLPGDRVCGPALIVEPQTTTFVSADFEASIDEGGNIWLTREEDKTL